LCWRANVLTSDVSKTSELNTRPLIPRPRPKNGKTKTVVTSSITLPRINEKFLVMVSKVEKLTFDVSELSNIREWLRMVYNFE